MKNNNLTSKKKKKQNIPKKVTRAKLDEDIHVSKILRFHKPTSRFVVQWKSNSDPVKTKLWKQVKYHTLETLDHLIVNNIINPMVTEFISANVTAQRYIEAYLVDHPNVHHLVSTTTTTTKTPLPSLKASNLSMTGMTVCLFMLFFSIMNCFYFYFYFFLQIIKEKGNLHHWSLPS